MTFHSCLASQNSGLMTNNMEQQTEQPGEKKPWCTPAIETLSVRQTEQDNGPLPPPEQGEQS